MTCELGVWRSRSVQARRRRPEGLPLSVAVCWSAHLVAVGGPTGGPVGDLPSSGSVPLASNADINEAGRRHTAAASNDRRTSRRWHQGHAWIELLEAGVAARILPGAPGTRPRTDHGP